MKRSRKQWIAGAVVCAMTLMLTGAAGADPVIDDDDLVIYFSFDEIDGSVVNESGRGNDGVIVGNVTFEADGARGGAARFAESGYLDLDGANFPASDIPTDGFTMAAWCNVQDTGGNHAIFNARAGDDTFLIHPEIRSGDYRIHLRGAGGTTIANITEGSPEFDTWVHYAVTYDTDGAVVRLYINGSEIANADAENVVPLPSDWNQGARVGYNVDDARPFTGLMDEFYMYQRALEASEITLLYQAGLYPITFNIDSDPPGLNVRQTQMDGGRYTIGPNEANSFWVTTTNWEPNNALLQAYETTSHLYNLGSPDETYNDGGHPDMTPRVVITNATLQKGNATWPVEDHFDWYRMSNATGPVTVDITYKAKDIAVTINGDPGLTGPSVVHHEVTGHSITLSEGPGYDVTDVTTTSGTVADNGDGTWTLAEVTDYDGVTLTVTSEIIDPTDVPDVVMDGTLSREDAEASITAAGLLVGSVSFSYSTTVPEGHVIGQSIPAGTTVPGGVTEVDIVVSQGPPPPMPLGWMPVLIVLMLIAFAVVGGQALRRRTQH